MGRDNRQALRERGIRTLSETRPELTTARRVWEKLHKSRRTEFLAWVWSKLSESERDAFRASVGAIS